MSSSVTALLHLGRRHAKPGKAWFDTADADTLSLLRCAPLRRRQAHMSKFDKPVAGGVQADAVVLVADMP